MNKLAETPYFPSSSRLSSAGSSALSGSGPLRHLAPLKDDRDVPNAVGSFDDNFVNSDPLYGRSMRAKPGSYAEAVLNHYKADPKYRDWKFSPQGAEIIGMDPRWWPVTKSHSMYNGLNMMKWFELNGGMPSADDIQFIKDTGTWRRVNFKKPDDEIVGTEPKPTTDEQKKIYPYLVNNSGVPEHVQKTAAYNDVRSMLKTAVYNKRYAEQNREDIRSMLKQASEPYNAYDVVRNMIKSALYSGPVPQFELPKPTQPAQKPVMDYNWRVPSRAIPTGKLPTEQQPTPAAVPTAPNGLSNPAWPQQYKQRPINYRQQQRNQQPIDYSQFEKYQRPAVPTIPTSRIISYVS